MQKQVSAGSASFALNLFPTIPNIHCGMSHQDDGYMNIKPNGSPKFQVEAWKNRAVFYAQTIPFNLRIIEPYLWHTPNVVVITEENIGVTPLVADGVVTTLSDVCLTVTGADCPGVVAYDPVAEIMGVAHSGWKGAAGDITGNLVEMFIRLGSLPRNIFIGIGPGIRVCCNEFGVNLTEQYFSHYEGCCVGSYGGKTRLDLVRVITIQAMRVGVPSSQIHASAVCTYCSTVPLYFSYRRDGGDPPKVGVLYLYHT